MPSSREEEEENAKMCLSGRPEEGITRITHIVGECEMCQEEQDVLKDMRGKNTTAVMRKSVVQ